MALQNRPSTIVSLRTTPSTPSVSTDTGVWFVSGLTDRGPLDPKFINSLQDFVNTFGDRQTYSPLYDSLDLFFREGGSKACVSRVVGPSATVGTLNLSDGAAGTSLVVSAIGPGAWSANYKIQVLAGVGGGTFVIRVLDTNNVILEDSGDLVDVNAAVQWSSYSNYVRIALGASSLDPAVAAATALSAGTDDRTNAVDTNWLAASDKFDKELGPGQISFPGRTSDTAHSQLIAHQATHNRVAILDYPDTATVATLQSSAAAARSAYAGGWAPWLIIPGVVAGQNRVVAPSGLIAGIIARNDPALGANHPGAGRFGQSRLAYDLSQPKWSDTDRNTLNSSGVNVIRRLLGVMTVFGWRSTSTDPNWIDFGNGRLYMALSARLDEVSQNYLFTEIDGQNGETVNGFHDGLAGVCMEFFISGQLFGDQADEAFSIDTGPGVNTLTTIANNELHAVVSVRMSPMAELVQIEIVKHAVTEAV